MYRDEDFSQIAKITVGPLGQSQAAAEGGISWATRSDSAEIFVAEVDGKVAGFLMLEWPGTEWNRVAEIGWIAVLQEHQRKGLGSALIKKMEQYAKDKRFRKVYVEPSADDKAALHFYIKNGYVPEAIRKDWYKDGEDSVILGKHL